MKRFIIDIGLVPMFVIACVILGGTALLLYGITLIHPAEAQVPPSGQPVLNQAVAGRLLTKSDSTVIQPTRGVYIGDAATCTIAVRFKNDTDPVTLATLQVGVAHPFSITKLMSANTTCTAVTALY